MVFTLCFSYPHIRTSLWKWSLMSFQKSIFCQKKKTISQNYKFQEFPNPKAQFSHWPKSPVFTLAPKPSFHTGPQSPVFTLAPKPSFHTGPQAQFSHWPPKHSFIWPTKPNSHAGP
ncbi:hypothetical protein VIGAN_04220700 [Vigna angularis var. angularis]|uniref:Uncharacterized protein n=1 Tax=Vigna angularis var. angularis TaxID=157739 RepID=A0A0S3RVZ1_PHAAN|nr:hypothetical protein VIGAN_04220700 [Vigna angularis var. angularis]